MDHPDVAGPDSPRGRRQTEVSREYIYFVGKLGQVDKVCRDEHAKASQRDAWQLARRPPGSKAAAIVSIIASASSVC